MPTTAAPTTGTRAAERLSPAFGALLRARRKALGLRSYELAVRAGLSPTTIIHYERSERLRLPPLAILRRLAAALELDVRDLITAAYALDETR